MSISEMKKDENFAIMPFFLEFRPPPRRDSGRDMTEKHFRKNNLNGQFNCFTASGLNRMKHPLSCVVFMLLVCFGIDIEHELRYN